MKTYRVEAHLLAPLALKRNRQSDRSETVQSIPGTTLRGALAAVYLQQRGDADETFRRLFMDESQCRVGPLDPAPQLYPLTMTACKRHPTDHAKLDQLAYRVALHLTHGDVGQEIHERFRHCGHPECGADMKAHVGFWDSGTEAPNDVDLDKKHVAAHVGIDRTTVTAADGMFYTLEALAPGAAGDDTDLVGWIQASDAAIQTLRDVLDEEQNVVYLGHHRTRGYGRVRLSLVDEPLSEEAEDESQRWGEWSDAMLSFAERYRDVSGTGFAPGTPEFNPDRDILFAVSLPTGAILVDHFLRYTNNLAAMVPWLPPLPNPAKLFPIDERPSTSLGEDSVLRCVAAVTNQQLLRGWNAAHGLPRQDEWMVARGSVYVYWFRGSPEQREHLSESLRQLANDGFGLRRNEGFGRIVINDPIHIEHLLQEVAS